MESKNKEGSEEERGAAVGRGERARERAQNTDGKYNTIQKSNMEIYWKLYLPLRIGSFRRSFIESTIGKSKISKMNMESLHLSASSEIASDFPTAGSLGGGLRDKDYCKGNLEVCWN